MERKGLLKESLTKFFSGVILLGALLFLPAGDAGWKNGWILMAALFVPMFFAGILMLVKAPDLLRSRLKAKVNRLNPESLQTAKVKQLIRKSLQTAKPLIRKSRRTAKVKQPVRRIKQM